MAINIDPVVINDGDPVSAEVIQRMNSNISKVALGEKITVINVQNTTGTSILKSANTTIHGQFSATATPNAPSKKPVTIALILSLKSNANRAVNLSVSNPAFFNSGLEMLEALGPSTLTAVVFVACSRFLESKNLSKSATTNWELSTSSELTSFIFSEVSVNLLREAINFSKGNFLVNRPVLVLLNDAELRSSFSSRFGLNGKDDI